MAWQASWPSRDGGCAAAGPATMRVMPIPFYQVDAFATRPFQGNPAAVCLLEVWPDDAWLQAVAAENNLSETAYLVAEGGRWRLRWFTPTAEVDLCGHATLAAAHVLGEERGVKRAPLNFLTRSGPLICERVDAGWQMDFPALLLRPLLEAPDLPDVVVRAALSGMDTVLELADADAVRRFDPGLAGHAAFASTRGLCVTAAGDDCDFVSRFFAPRLGIVEDPVTGSAHCALAPYWAARWGKSVLHARQLSARGGELLCQVEGDRVLLRGQAVTVIRGALTPAT